MSKTSSPLETYTPSERDEVVLAILKDADGDIVRTAAIQDRSGFSPHYLHMALNKLVAAGWVERPKRGRYRFVEDPRPVWEQPDLEP